MNGGYVTRNQDQGRAGRFSRPATSMFDNPGFTGLHARFLPVAARFKIPDIGGGAERRYPLPVHPDVRAISR